MKVSREGVVLIKSFEGFRARAVVRDDGRWTIGYGHTASAREGLTVGEADAELLLQYDLMPIVKALNSTALTPVNQHQFDALASFAFSVGLDRFLASDVVARVNDGAASDAAEALVRWPVEQTGSETLRRRAAERALFVADPAAPVALADLLTTPLPEPEPESAPAPANDAEPIPRDAVAASSDPRAFAVASLLGETHDAVAEVEFAAEETPETAAPAEPAAGKAVEPVEDIDADVDQVAAAEPEGSDEIVSADAEPLVATAPMPEAQEVEAAPVVPVFPSPPPIETTAIASEPQVIGTPAEEPRPVAADNVTYLNVSRYMPYGAPMSGVLQGLSPTPVDEPDIGLVVAADREVAPAFEPTPVDTPEPDYTPEAAAPAFVEALSVAEPSAADSTPPVLTFPSRVEPAEAPPTGPLWVLTPPEDDPEPTARPVWPEAQRAVAHRASEDGRALFGDDLDMQDHGVLRHETPEPQPGRAIDWADTGAFVIMGGVGLASFGAAMAAFRLAADQPGMETTIIAWVLALIGATCVGVSSYNLYRRWGRSGS